MRSEQESREILWESFFDNIIVDWEGPNPLFDPPGYTVVVKLLDGWSYPFNGVSPQAALHRASDYCIIARKDERLRKVMQANKAPNDVEKTKETTMIEKQPEDVQYLHLRRFKRDGARGLPIGIAWAKGGITLCYIKEGQWYKVGAAFCSSQDDYVDVAGEVLAKERLFTSPMYIHEYDWKGDVARRLTCPQGRQWYEHAVQQGYPNKWKLKEYKDLWLDVTVCIDDIWPWKYRI